jgi:pyrimidine deaminase RibD-like protein/NTP pyrophosphatase (non-canonical NTP hydrolase)
MELAVEEAKKSRSEDDRAHPKVGAVAVRDGQLLGAAYRGELGQGDHAEFTLLEKKLKESQLAGATVYTTLEPCTSRNHPKVPCAVRLAERKVARVVVGMLDPNPKISGKGFQELRASGIDVSTDFPKDLKDVIEEINRDFIRSYRSSDRGRDSGPSRASIEHLSQRELDEWYKMLNGIYWDRNYNRNYMEIFAHLVEVFGGMSLLASNKTKPEIEPTEFVPKALAWWFTLCGKVGVKSVSSMVWAKFPGVCAYCHKVPHDPEECDERKKNSTKIDWETLGQIGITNARQKPQRVSEWQRMFGEIYPVQQTEDFGSTFARLVEELGELAEALRIFPAAPGYFLSEAADLFAWLMHIQNIVDRRVGARKANRGLALERAFLNAYPDRCGKCGERMCTCPPLPKDTIGRIAHEVPPRGAMFGEQGSFLPPDRALAMFRPAF